MADVIRIEHLVKKFGEFTAVNDVNLAVKEGEIFGLLGPNGAGKTTTINMLLTLLTPTSGKIFISNMELSKNHAKAKLLMGLMTQETVVEADLTGRQNLDLFTRLYHLPTAVAKRRIKEALEEADLVEFADVKSGKYSGGMQRRLGLVKAMIQEPKILVLDEPTTGLDVQNRTTMWARIKELNKRGTTIILTTQYLEEADQLCDRLGIIDHGKVIALGTPSEIKRIAGSGRILEIVVKADETAKVASLLKSRFGIIATVRGDKVTAVLEKGKESEFTKISALMDKERITILSIGTHLPTLDDVFIKLTGTGMRDAAGAMAGGRANMRWR
ncbi:MAG TPA: ATP-binding cassette domain-containing protein [Candidatus Acidoferrum sp.]|nr:ATP-binding cassette domain-containing protein [Candidatus Acidoferrum sp.]